MNSVQKSLDYGDFVPAKKKFSQKIDETQGSFVRVNPNVTKLSIDGDKITIISKLSPIVPKNEPAVAESEALPESEQIKITGGEDFTFETPDESVPHRSDEIKKFLADDRRSLKLKKNAFNLLQKYENRERIEDEKASRVKQPIGVKLVVIISFLLILAYFYLHFIIYRDSCRYFYLVRQCGKRSIVKRDYLQTNINNYSSKLHREFHPLYVLLRRCNAML